MPFVLLTEGSWIAQHKEMRDWMDPLQGRLLSCSFWSSWILQFSPWYLIILILY